MTGWLRLSWATGLAVLLMGTGCTAASLYEQVDTQVFPTDKVVDVKLYLDPEDLQSMYADPQAKEYHEATVIYHGTQVEHIAVRTKGNSSLGMGQRGTERLPLKLDFNYYIEWQSLFGIKKINLNPGFSDPTYIREILSYEAFASLGVAVPRASFVQLYVNDELWGLYLAVQQIDKVFVAEHFKTASGDLYKPDGVGSDMVWRGGQISSYPGMTLKTNEETSDHQALIKMLDELNNGTDYESVLDVDAALRYLAASTVMSNLDSYQGALCHNYYLYEQDGRFTILPWDLNMSFAGFNMGMNKTQMVEMLIDEPTMGSVAERPLIAKLLAVPEYLERYHQYIETLVNGYLDPEAFKQRAISLTELIWPYIETDPNKYYSLEQCSKALYEDVGSTVGLISFVESRVAHAKKQLSGEIPSSGDGSGMGIAGRGGAPGGFPDRDAWAGAPRPAGWPAERVQGQQQAPPEQMFQGPPEQMFLAPPGQMPTELAPPEQMLTEQEQAIREQPDTRAWPGMEADKRQRGARVPGAEVIPNNQAIRNPVQAPVADSPADEGQRWITGILLGATALCSVGLTFLKRR